MPCCRSRQPCRYFWVRFCFSFLLPSAITTTIAWTATTDVVPQRIQLDQVSVQYPPTLLRKLFSSVPVREYALFNITTTIDPGTFLLLTGASSSGKSSLLQVIGATSHNNNNNNVPISQGTVTYCAQPSAIPIYLDAQKPPVELRRSVRQVLLKDDSIDAAIMMEEDGTMSRLEYLLCQVQLDPNAILDAIPSQLAPSELYRMQLVQACLQSMSPTTTTTTFAQPQNASSSPVPAPILLLDEWLDKETSQVIQKVQQALLQLVQDMGAIVCVVTHKPERWALLQQQQKPSLWIRRHITMCRGEILSDVCQ